MGNRVALIFMPFGGCTSPCLGISSLKGALSQKKLGADIHYFDVTLAAQIGFDLYSIIAERLPPVALVGEWLFAPVLFGENATADERYVKEVLWGEWKDLFTPEMVMEMLHLRDRCVRFLFTCLDVVDWSKYAVIGFSTSTAQNCSSLALARLIKERFPAVKMVMGGSNCADPMGAALIDLFPFVDFVCTGEGEIAFPRLVEALLGGEPVADIPGILSQAGTVPVRRIVSGDPIADLDSLPYPDHTDYFSQLYNAKADPGFVPYVPMETARGCWRRKARCCTFCGVNGPLLTFRSKSPARVMEELTYTKDTYGVDVLFADTILDRNYFKTLLPDLAKKMPGTVLGWDVTANLNRDEIALLARAGLTTLVPGIESLSDSILKLIRKGTTSLQNIQTLKWSRQFGMTVLWNLLFGFPGEDPAEYNAMETLLPLLFHLPPPRCIHILFQRHSEYVNNPADFGITAITPKPVYRWIYHSLCKNDVKRLAFYFDAEYTDDSENYARGVIQAVKKWQTNTDAVLDVFIVGRSIRIVDTRMHGWKREYQFNGISADIYLLCDAAQDLNGLVTAPSIHGRVTEKEITAILDRFIKQRLMIREGSRYLSLGVIRKEYSISIDAA